MPARLSAASIAVHSPVPRSSTQLGVVFNLRLGATCPHGSHAPVSKAEGDHLTALTGRKYLKCSTRQGR